MTPEITTALTRTLLHFLWQGAAIAFLLSLLLIVFRNASAQLRYACCCGALALCAILPAVTFFITLQAKPRASMALALELLATPAIAQSAAISSDMSPVAASAPVSGMPWNDWVLLLWAVGVMACSVRLMLGQYGAWKLRQGEPITGDLARRAREIAQEMGWTRGIAIIKSTLVEVPSVTGWLKPVLLIPPAALMGLTAAQLEAVVAHELAHVRRHDYVVNVLQTILETLLFYHPAVWWISRQIRQEREYCCDDAAVTITGDAILYARALASLEHLRRAEQNLTKAFLGASTGGNLMQRIQRLHRRMAGDNSARQTSAKWTATPVAGLCGLACAASITVWIAVLTPGLALGQSEQEPARAAPEVIENSMADEDINNGVEVPPAEASPAVDPETRRNLQRNIQREVDRQVRREIQRNVERTIRRNIDRQVQIAQATAQEAARAAQRNANGNPMSDEQRAQLQQEMEQLRQQFAEGGEFQKEMEQLRRELGEGGKLQQEMEELRKQFAPGGEFQKEMEQFREQFQEGGEFQKEMEDLREQFGEGGEFQKQMQQQFGPGSDFQKQMEDLRKQFGEGSEFQQNLRQQLERTLPQQQQQPEPAAPEANQAQLLKKLLQLKSLPPIERVLGQVDLPQLRMHPLPPLTQLAQNSEPEQQELDRARRELERARQQVIEQEQRIREEAEHVRQQGEEQRAAREEAAAQAKKELQVARQELERTRQRLAEREAGLARQRAEQERQQVRNQQRLAQQEAEQALQRATREREQAFEQARQQQAEIQELKRELERLKQERQQQSTVPQANQP